MRAATRQALASLGALLLPPVAAYALAHAVLAAAALSTSVNPAIAGSWCRFDCSHYLTIAVRGYLLQPCESAHDMGLWCGNAAWLPGFPLVVRAARAAGVPPRTAGVRASRLCVLATLVALWGSLSATVGRRRAALALALAAFFPGALYAHAFSPIGLYGLFVVASLLAAARGRPVWAGLAGAAATFTYPTGLLMAPVLAIGFLAGRGDAAARRGGALVSALLAAAGFASVVVLQYRDTGSWYAFTLVQSGYHYAPTAPWTAIHDRIAPLLRPPFEGVFEAPAAQTLLVLVIVGSGAVAVGRLARHRGLGRLEVFAALYAGAAWLMPLLVGEVEGGLHRREAAILPVVLLTAHLPSAWQSLLAACALAVAWPMAVLFFRGQLV